MTVYEEWNRVMEGVQGIGKHSRNSDQGYHFRGIDAVMNAVGPQLREHGVAVVPVKVRSRWRDVLTSRDKRSRECTVKVIYRVYGPEGDHFDIASIGESMDFGDKGAAKAMSVAMRVALLQALCIPTDEPDPDEHTYERAASQTPPPPPDPLVEAKRHLATLAQSRLPEGAVLKVWIQGQFAERNLNPDSIEDVHTLTAEWSAS